MQTIRRYLKKILPKGLYGRTIIIIIAPMVFLQSIVAYILMERHWEIVTEHLSSALVNDIASLIDIIEYYPQDNNYDKITRIAAEKMQLNIGILPQSPFPAPLPHLFFSNLDYFLSKKIKQKISNEFWLDTVGNSNLIEIRIKLKHKILRIFAKRSQTYASHNGILLMWMTATLIVLLIITIYFLKLQIQPLQQLAQVAEKFGKGEHMQGYYPRGADEVRRAGIAFLRMRQRIERQIKQRTMMLSGVSHDLRTIITRFRLALYLLKDKIDISALEQDIVDMTKMIDAYLDFTKNTNEEQFQDFDLQQLCEKLSNQAKIHKIRFNFKLDSDIIIKVMPRQFTRLINNLIENSFRYATNVEFTSKSSNTNLIIYIDDNGRGIPANMRQEVFKPFFRLDEARNQNSASTGLGLAIALDIARKHGGNISLAKSHLGGLRAIIYLPN